MPFSGTGPLLLFLAKATLLLVAAIIATVMLRRSTAGARHLVWLAALVGVLALPLLSRIPALQLEILPSRLGVGPAAAVALAPARASVSAAPARAITGPARAPRGPAPAAVVPVPAVPAVAALPAVAPVEVAEATEWPAFFNGGWASSALLTLAIVWGAVAIALLGWLVAGAIQVRRIVASARELTTPDWTTPLCEVADRLDLELPPRLVLSDRIEMAFACRALSPTIVLPAAAETWTDDRRRAVLFHELAHVKRHDLLSHTLGRVACALYWFHPLVWTAAKNLRAESERACDDLVLSCGARPSEYAQHLLDMVTSVKRHGAPVMALPMARKKEFEGRMLAILDPAIRRASPGKLQASGVIASLAVLSLTVAAVAPATATPAPAHAVPELATAVQESRRPQEPVVPQARQRPIDSESQMPSASPAPSPSPGPSVRPNTDVRTNTALNDFVKAVAKAGASMGEAAAKRVVDGLVSGTPQQAGDTARASLLIKILETDKDASVRRTAAWGLNEMGGDRVRAALTKALKDDADSDVREMAAWAMADAGDEGSATVLAEALLKDKDAHVRETAAWGLGELGAQRGIDALESALTDADAHVRQSAIWAIGQIGPRTAPRGIVNALTDASNHVRLTAAWALGEIADKSAAPGILKAFQAETDAQVRSAELRALAAAGAATPDVVQEALKSTDPQLRRRAVAMLAGSNDGVWNWPWPQPRPRPMP
jgi:HEAT repeat protein/beta-lactamase regulating signal transducer with metallopeptidase domain